MVSKFPEQLINNLPFPRIPPILLELMDGRKRKILKPDDRSARFNALPVPATRPLTSGVDHWPAVTYAPNEPTLRTFTRNFRTRGAVACCCSRIKSTRNSFSLRPWTILWEIGKLRRLRGRRGRKMEARDVGAKFDGNRRRPLKITAFKL